MGNLLTNLATLKVYWDQTDTDLLSNFMPLVGYAIKTLPNNIVSEDELIERIYQVAEFKIPRAAANILIRRASKSRYRYIYKEGGNYVRNDSAVSHLDFENVRRGISDKFEALKNSFEKYISIEFPHATERLETEYYLFDILYDMTPRLIGNLYDQKAIELVDKLAEDNNAEYRVAKFVEHCHLNDLPSYELIMAFAQGAILSESFFYSNPETVATKLRNVRVFLDTSLVLTILGYSESVFRTPHLELIEILESMNARLCIFDVTLKEIQRIFLAAENARLSTARFTPFRPGDVFDYFMRNGYSPSDIKLEAEKLDERLRRLGFHVENRPPISAALGVDEVKLNEYLNREFGSETPIGNLARQHDIDSVTAIYRLRSGEPQKYFESCKAIFVTGNFGLVRAVNAYFKDELGDTSDAPIIIGDRIFTMLMWLKAVDKKPALPRHQIVANSLAAMSPARKLWDNFLQEAQRLAAKGQMTQADYNIMAFSLEARTALMALTEGDQSAVSEGTLLDVLKRSKDLILTETRTDYEKKLATQNGQLRRIETLLTNFESAIFGFVKYLSLFVFFSLVAVGFLFSSPSTIISIVSSSPPVDFIRVFFRTILRSFIWRIDA